MGQRCQSIHRFTLRCLYVGLSGYGKSEGSIRNQQQLFDDNQAVYNTLKKEYDERKMVILGYSIGSGPAAKLASANHPKLLILQTPYYSLTDMIGHHYPYTPTFLLKYKLETNKYLKECKMPLVIFHGDSDEVIYYGSSLKLEKEFKPSDRLITLHGQQHNGISNHPDYLPALKAVLEENEE